MILRLPRFQAHRFAQLFQRLVVLMHQAAKHGQVASDGSGSGIPSHRLAIVLQGLLRLASGNQELSLLQLAARLIGVLVEKQIQLPRRPALQIRVGARRPSRRDAGWRGTGSSSRARNPSVGAV